MINRYIIKQIETKEGMLLIKYVYIPLPPKILP